VRSKQARTLMQTNRLYLSSNSQLAERIQTPHVLLNYCGINAISRCESLSTKINLIVATGRDY
jgi:hypothetical protein